jgi:RNA recognition motif-containing protein
MVLFFGNLHFSVIESELFQLLEPYAPIKSVKIIFDKKGRSKGFAFIDFEDENKAKSAMFELNEKVIRGRAISIKLADQQ